MPTGVRSVMDSGGRTEERVGSVIIEAQRHELWVRSEADGNGVWHNMLLFRRDGIHSTSTEIVAGVDWHVPPAEAHSRALRLDDPERMELYRKALRPRPPLA